MSGGQQDQLYSSSMTAGLMPTTATDVFFSFFLGWCGQTSEKLHSVKKWYRILDTHVLCILSHLKHQSWNSFQNLIWTCLNKILSFEILVWYVLPVWQAGFGMDSAFSGNSKIFWFFFLQSCGWMLEESSAHKADIPFGSSLTAWHTHKKNHFLFVVALELFT